MSPPAEILRILNVEPEGYSDEARAILEGRYAASIEDVNAVAVPVLRHRIVTNFNAEAQGIAPTDLIDRIIG